MTNSQDAAPKRRAKPYPCIFCGSPTNVADEAHNNRTGVTRRRRVCTVCKRDMRTKDDGK